MNILFIGPPAAGKGTQTEMLAKKLKIPYISSGNIFREHILKQTKLGKAAEKYIKHGDLVPNKITNMEMEMRLRKKDAKKGFVLDGYPRNLVQARYLHRTHALDIVFEIVVPAKDVISRIGGRRTCSCGAVYHIKFKPPKRAGYCDKCGKRLFIRDDDKKTRTRNRLKIYNAMTKKLIPYYEKRGILVKINGLQSIAKVHKDIIGEM